MQMRTIAAGFALAAALVFGACDAADGAKGPVGDPGAVGDQGPTGSKGATGDTGATGDQGAAGDPGVAGDKGETGDKGATGDTGTVGIEGPCFDSEPLTIIGTTGLPDYLLVDSDSSEFTIDVETESGLALTDGLQFTWLADGPELVQGTADNAFTVPTDTAGAFTYELWVTDGCSIATGTVTVNVEAFAGHVALVHASQIAGSVGVALTGTTERLTTLDFLDTTGHYAVGQASVQFDLLDASDAVVMTTPPITLEHREYVTLVAYDDAQGVVHLAVIDDVAAPLAAPATTWAVRAFHAAAGFGAVDVTDRAATDAVLFNDLALGTLAAEQPVRALGAQSFGLDVGGNGVIDYTFNFTTGGAFDPVVAGEVATVFVVDTDPFPTLLVRSARPGEGATYAAAVPVDPASLVYDVIVGEGSLAPTNPTPLALDITAGSLDYTRTLAVTGCPTIDFITVGVDILHEYRGDLQLELTSPDGTTVVLSESAFISTDDFVGVFVDGGADTGGTYDPSEPLATFGGVVGNGTWTFDLSDTFSSSDDGTFNGWSLNLICGN